MEEQKNNKISKDKLLSVLNNWKLQTPKSEIKTMPEGLRKEAREYVKSYIGSYSEELKTIRSLKKELFLDIHKEELEKEILNNKEIKTKIKEYDDTFKIMKRVYDECIKDVRLSISNSMYQFEKGSTEKYRITVSDSYVDSELDKKFDLLYGQGFKEFNDLLKKFEQKIEEAILFGTITDVYNIIQKYSKFDEFSKKLSNVVVK